MNWYCLNTRPTKESQVAAYLSERLGLDTYSPRLIQQKTLRGVMTEVAGPLFPKYLFCRFDLATRYDAVRQAPEVVDLVRSGGEPVTVAAAIVAQLRDWAGEGVDILNFQPGDHGARVEITGGVSHALPEAILKSPNGRDRVAILLSILENRKAESIPGADPESAGKSPLIKELESSSALTEKKP